MLKHRNQHQQCAGRQRCLEGLRRSGIVRRVLRLPVRRLQRQVDGYGLPSGRLLKFIRVFSQNPENGWGYNEETKPMLQTTYGFIPWDDTHHAELSQTDGVPDGRWLFINGNNTPRVARIDLTTFETTEILQIPNAAGGHASPFTTPNTKYIVSATRFSVPIPNADVPIDSYKQNFKGTLSFITADQPGKMDIAFQILMPGFNYDLGHAGKGPSDGWFFFTIVQHRAGNDEARAERIAERQGFHRRGELPRRPSSALRRARRKRSTRPTTSTT